MQPILECVLFFDLLFETHDIPIAAPNYYSTDDVHLYRILRSRLWLRQSDFSYPTQWLRTSVPVALQCGMQSLYGPEAVICLITAAGPS